MGLLTSALQIGRSALLSYQSALHIVGQNVANASNPDYTRQSPVLRPIRGVPLPEGMQPGAGVALTDVRRHVDEQLEARLRTAVSDQEQSSVEQRTIGRIESLLNELTESDLSTFLSEFFNAFSELQIDPASLTARDVVLISADALNSAVQRQRFDLDSLREELNDKLVTFTNKANLLASDVAKLNEEIVRAESAGNATASALRDQRDAALRDLAELVEIRTLQQEFGSVLVYIGNEPLVEHAMARPLVAAEETTNGLRTVTIRFADNQSAVTLAGGSMAGAAISRDTHVVGQVQRLDQLATSLIHEINKIHALGQGLPGSRFTTTTGTYSVTSATATLDTTTAGSTVGADLDLSPQNGSFLITTFDAAGAPTEMQIDVDLDGIGADDSLTSLAAKINAHPDNGGAVTATVTADNRLQLVAGTGIEFTFKEDSSNVLAALGINTFFDGSNASNITVNAAVSADPGLIAAATQNLPGDGSNAGRLAALGRTAAAALGGLGIQDFYASTVSGVAVAGAATRSAYESTSVVFASLNAQSEGLSGVSLDEEAIQLLRMERAFQGAARYIQVVDRMIGEMLNLLR